MRLHSPGANNLQQMLIARGAMGPPQFIGNNYNHHHDALMINGSIFNGGGQTNNFSQHFMNQQPGGRGISPYSGNKWPNLPTNSNGRS